jgi:hypothetical protein
MYEFKKGHAVKRLKDGDVFEIVEVVGSKKSPKHERFHGSWPTRSYLLEYRGGAIRTDLRVSDGDLRDGTWQVFPKGIEDAKSTCLKGKFERDGSASCFGCFLEGHKACGGCALVQYCRNVNPKRKAAAKAMPGVDPIPIGSVFLGLNTRTHWEVIDVDYPSYLIRNVEDPTKTVWVQYRNLTDTSFYVPEGSMKGVGISVGTKYRRLSDDSCWQVAEFVPSNYLPSHQKARMLGTWLTPTYVLEYAGAIPKAHPLVEVVYAYELIDLAKFVPVEKKEGVPPEIFKKGDVFVRKDDGSRWEVTEYVPFGQWAKDISVSTEAWNMDSYVLTVMDGRRLKHRISNDALAGGKAYVGIGKFEPVKCSFKVGDFVRVTPACKCDWTGEIIEVVEPGKTPAAGPISGGNLTFSTSFNLSYVVKATANGSYWWVPLTEIGLMPYEDMKFMILGLRDRLKEERKRADDAEFKLRGMGKSAAERLGDFIRVHGLAAEGSRQRKKADLDDAESILDEMDETLREVAEAVTKARVRLGVGR